MSEPNTPKSTSQDERVGRILNDFHDRRARGEPVSEERLLAEHPDLANDLKPYLEMLGDLRSEGDRIKRLVADGVLRESDDPAYQATLGDYKTVGFIGRGGMGIVLKAHEESLNRTVALKILRPELADDKASLQRFTREAKAAGMLRHPNIVTVYSVGEQHGVNYIAMEYIEGPTLADLIHEQAPLPTEFIRRLFREVLLGLAAAHEAGLIHRDIKSANILLDGSEQLAKIADFGLARMSASQTRITLPESAPGTPEYMSPEQARGDEDIDHRADLYSAGVVLYEMLTGRTPFKADTPSAVIHQILHEEPTDPRTVNEHVDPHLASVAMRLMAKRPDDRLSSADETLKALEDGARVPSLAKRRWRRKLVACTGGLVVIFAALWAGGRTLNLPLLGDPRISEIKMNGTKLSVRHDGGDEFTDFFDFEGLGGSIAKAGLFEFDERGVQTIVAGLSDPFGKDILFAFGGDGQRLWQAPLDYPRKWPDCARVDLPWRIMSVGKLESNNGDMLLVVSHLPKEYPTAISIVEPRTGQVCWTFFHNGNIDGADKLLPEKDRSKTPGYTVLRDYFEDGKPAIIAWGVNNKLDGFGLPRPPRPYKEQEGEDKPRTPHDHVPVVMILRPYTADWQFTQEGVGPPCAPQLEQLTCAKPFAYAFLDIPADEKHYRDPGDGAASSLVSLGTAVIARVNVHRHRRNAANTRSDFFTIEVHESPRTTEGNERASIRVDSELRWLNVTDDCDAPHDAAWWKDRWHVICQGAK